MTAHPSRTPAQLAAVFRALHARDGIFLIPNPWDVGTARMLAGLGYEALATTSAGHGFSLGHGDNTLTREATLAHARDIVSATDLPVSADLGNGFGDGPDDVAETIRLAGETGLAGASVEDATYQDTRPVYDIGLAIERVRAACEAAHALPVPLVLTARAENFIVGRPDLADTIKRLQAFQDAGADVLYAPGLLTLDDVRAVVTSVDRPVNVLAGIAGARFTMADLAAAGVRRVSTGSALARAALGEFLRAVAETRERGTFGYVDRAASSTEIARLLSR
jgi:2-methylisocitrate lyase-like PEP mutase family enzyme